MARNRTWSHDSWGLDGSVVGSTRFSWLKYFHSGVLFQAEIIRSTERKTLKRDNIAVTERSRADVWTVMSACDISASLSESTSFPIKTRACWCLIYFRRYVAWFPLKGSALCDSGRPPGDWSRSSARPYLVRPGCAAVASLKQNIWYKFLWISKTCSRIVLLVNFFYAYSLGGK